MLWSHTITALVFLTISLIPATAQQSRQRTAVAPQSASVETMVGLAAAEEGATGGLTTLPDVTEQVGVVEKRTECRWEDLSGLYRALYDQGPAQ